jgi:hypothetical protein
VAYARAGSTILQVTPDLVVSMDETFLPLMPMAGASTKGEKERAVVGGADQRGLMLTVALAL